MNKPKVVEKIKQGRRIYGQILELSNGTIIALANLRQKDIERGNERNLSDAVHSGAARWLIDADFIAKAKNAGAKFVGVKVRENDDTYLTPIAMFSSEKNLARSISRGRYLFRALSLTHFNMKPGQAKI